MRDRRLNLNHPTRRGLLSNRRGAAFLLAVYLSALTCLLLTGVSLQRTTTEIAAARTSRDLHQAFWLAEAALDYGVAYFKTHDINDGDTRAVPAAYGSAGFTVTTVGSEVVSPETQRLTWQMIGTGTSGGRTARVTATITEDQRLHGIWAEGPMYVASMQHQLTLNAPLRTGVGTARAVTLQGTTGQVGQVQIGPAAKAPRRYSYGQAGDKPGPWTRRIGSNGATDGVLLAENAWGLGTTSVTEPSVAVMAPLGTVATAPYPASQCDKPLIVPMGTTAEIADGDTLDLDPREGQIGLCVQYLVTGWGAGSGVLFRAPATVYVTGKDRDNTAVHVKEIWAVDPGHVVAAAAPLIPDGVKIIVTKAPKGEKAGRIQMLLSRFSGSIYAPESYLLIYPGGNGRMSEEKQVIGHIVAKDIDIASYGLGAPMAFVSRLPSGFKAPSVVNVVGWLGDGS